MKMGMDKIFLNKILKNKNKRMVLHRLKMIAGDGEHIM